MKKSDETRLLKFIWLTMACGADSGCTYKVYSKFETIDKVYTADEYDIQGLTDEQYRNLLDKRLDNAFEVLKRCKAIGVSAICVEDKAYPDKLKYISDPPLVVYCKGKMIDFDESFCVAMVGTRKMSDYGCETAKYLAEGIATAGAVVISGLAKGIDSVCQRSALNAGGVTVGVIGNSIDTIYPKENAALFNKIYNYGLVIGEYWPGCSTNKYSFPRRNRIIAALSNIVIVVQAPASSGAMITATHAVKQGKSIYVPPMPLTEENAGTAALLRGGANLITSVGDLLMEYEAALPHKIPPDMPLPSLTGDKYDISEGTYCTAAEEKELVYNFLLEELQKNGPETLQQASANNNHFTIQQLLSAAISLELDGYIKRTVGGRYDAVPIDIKPINSDD